MRYGTLSGRSYCVGVLGHILRISAPAVSLAYEDSSGSGSGLKRRKSDTIPITVLTGIFCTEWVRACNSVGNSSLRSVNVRECDAVKTG